MTLRVYDDEGTPYEQTIDIRETVHRAEIPYNNTRRAKRKRKDTNALTNGDLPVVGGGEDVVLTLGDVLSSATDMQEWKLVDWSSDDDDRMAMYAFEWIRIDADLEWICEISLGMPEWMYAAQLQQDRDVVAQYDVSSPPPSREGKLTLGHKILWGNQRVCNDFNNHGSHFNGRTVLLRYSARSRIRPRKGISVLQPNYVDGV